ncbi:MAG: hypothetical protein A2Y25_06875 [Candidatus Melainabacteria bacterium GWF2_37_15]|nr:MAG: hypothetical protein A2Y25_06875 [Candidatus Melainabacteria bacterium GWF2_37_15]
MIKRFLLLTIFTLIISIYFILPNKAESQFGGVLVYPNVVELDFTDNRTFVSRAIQVENPTSKPFRVRAYVEGWNLNEYGGIEFLAQPDKFSLNDNLKFNPREFDLAPGQKQMVRLTAKLPPEALGEYRSIIFFETVNPKQDILNQNNKLNINVQFKTRYGVAVYAYKGDVARSALLENFKYEEVDGNAYLVATIKNPGNIHCNVEGDITLVSETDKNNTLTSPLARYTIMPNSTQKYRILVPDTLNSGTYNALLKLNYNDIDKKPQVIGGETKLKYKATKSAAKNPRNHLQNVNAEQKIEKTPENIAKPINLDLDNE